MSKLVHRPRVRYHRNGCHGESFHLVEFEDHVQRKRAHRLLATVFETRGCVAVVCPDKPLLRWRGDIFEDELRAVIAAAGNEVHAHGG